MAENRFVFEVADWKQRPVRLTRRTFDRHSQYHPEVPRYVEEAKQAIGDPDVVLDAGDGALRLCRLGLGRGAFARAWLVVVVYYRRGRGW